ncbi:MAG: hypothetical protein K6T81_04265 [Alicyclobacillus macrosporangiidus]|uniref:hypothetical protein n=1 Tax=Alicyclobacillus macrosporangiidus TaxID=392015 RepID=UPI0026EE59DF|nr:hypothetical protein [Alicyclobacillus macrosporangiidus]MCL6597933.1 hypothetical protein [Alicyclobacillus macrosporangiidus]
MKGNKGVNRLARALDARMQAVSSSPDELELGTIQSDMSLKLDGFGAPIPQGHYLVCRSLTLPDPMAVTSPGGENVPRPAQLAPLKPGDRVLVAWVNQGTDPVVIDVVVSS